MAGDGAGGPRAQRQIDAGSGPYFYLPKLENAYDARLWNDVFVFAQDLLGIPRGTIRATVLIETVTAAFEMEEILYELREHSAGLNAGRWDYLFSLIKIFAHRPDFSLPDRTKVTMTAPFLRAYTELLVRTCHKRGAHAIGGMAAHVPGHDAQADGAALAKVRLDKEREAEDGVRANISVALRYFDAWLRGTGAVALEGLMEDAAAAEIARAQIWQWLRHGAVDRDTVLALLDDEIAALGAEYPWARADEVRALFERMRSPGSCPPSSPRTPTPGSSCSTRESPPCTPPRQPSPASRHSPPAPSRRQSYGPRTGPASSSTRCSSPTCSRRSG